MKNHTHTHHIILPKWLWNRNYDTADINGLEPALCVSHVWTPSLRCFPSCWDKIRISRGVWPCYFICGGWRFAVHQNSDMFKVKVLTFQRVSDTPKKLTSQLRVCYGKSPMIYLQKLRVFFSMANSSVYPRAFHHIWGPEICAGRDGGSPTSFQPAGISPVVGMISISRLSKPNRLCSQNDMKGVHLCSLKFREMTSILEMIKETNSVPDNSCSSQMEKLTVCSSNVAKLAGQRNTHSIHFKTTLTTLLI